mgnify:CR=1 FL=1
MFTFEIVAGDSLSVDGVVRMAGVSVFATTLTGRGSEEAELLALRQGFALHLADVLSRPRPFCDCPHRPLA